MTKQETNPDAVASKTFIITLLGTILYVAVVFIFVIGGNEEIGKELEASKGTQAGQHHD